MTATDPRRLSTSRGVVLILAVGCMAILAGLVAGLFQSASAVQGSISRRESELRAALAAQSGINYAIARLRQRGLRYYYYTASGEPPLSPELQAEDGWVTSGNPLAMILQDNFGPHESSRSTFTLQVTPAFTRANLTDPANLGAAVRFRLTADGYHRAEDGRVLARKSLTTSFVGCNVVLFDAGHTP